MQSRTRWTRRSTRSCKSLAITRIRAGCSSSPVRPPSGVAHHGLDQTVVAIDSSSSGSACGSRFDQVAVYGVLEPHGSIKSAVAALCRKREERRPILLQLRHHRDKVRPLHPSPPSAIHRSPWRAPLATVLPRPQRLTCLLRHPGGSHPMRASSATARRHERVGGGNSGGSGGVKQPGHEASTCGPREDRTAL